MKKNLEKELASIKERNKKVEADKAWEISITRRGIIAVFTYVALGIFLNQINAPNPWLTAIVPAAAYVLSTMTLPFVKKWWVEKEHMQPPEQ